MFIVDAQAHVWAPSTPERPWPSNRPIASRPMNKELLLGEMEAAGVDRVVIVPPSFEGYRNDLALDAAHTHPERFAVMGQLDPKAPDARARVPGWRREPGMLGLRFTLNKPLEQQQLSDGSMDWLWRAAEEAKLPIMAYMPHSDLHLLERVAQRYPALKLAIDHLGLPLGQKDDAAFAGIDKLLALAKHSNVAVKASGLPAHTSDTYPYRRLHPYLRRVYDAFGPRRFFWGSDLTRLPCSYSQAVTMFSEEIPWLTNEDKEWIMGRGVCEWTGWPLPQAMPATKL